MVKYMGSVDRKGFSMDTPVVTSVKCRVMLTWLHFCMARFGVFGFRTDGLAGSGCGE